MTRTLPISALALAFWPVLAPAGSGQGGTTPQPIRADTLERLRWQARPVVILAERAPLAAQVLALTSEPAALAERDIVLLIEGPGAGPLRDQAGSGFAVLLIGKDGGVKRIWHEPVDPEDIFALIDAMPMRRREAGQDG
ncbi:MAG: DUF4174 domain-containing protein [Paracoccus sp. (in: a-proteobacteria)]|uniref:DUF4174 domain-containing protein n=1 Tax=Paracoccus sp. TaxID=267 RepID=UPI0040587722